MLKSVFFMVIVLLVTSTQCGATPLRYNKHCKAPIFYGKTMDGRRVVTVCLIKGGSMVMVSPSLNPDSEVFDFQSIREKILIDIENYNDQYSYRVVSEPTDGKVDFLLRGGINADKKPFAVLYLYENMDAGLSEWVKWNSPTKTIEINPYTVVEFISNGLLPIPIVENGNTK